MMDRKKLLLWSSGAVVFIVVMLIATTRCSSEPVEQSAPEAEIAQGIDTVPMLIMQVKKCSKLYTAEYRVHKIITHDDDLRLKGQLKIGRAHV